MLPSRLSIGINSPMDELFKSLGQPWGTVGLGWVVLFPAVPKPVEWHLRTRCNFCFNNGITNMRFSRPQIKSLSWSNTKEVRRYFLLSSNASDCSIEMVGSAHRQKGLCSKPAWLLAWASNAAHEGLIQDDLMDTVWVLEAREAKKMRDLSADLFPQMFNANPSFL